MGATELLKLIVTADTKQAVASVSALGKESEASLAKGATGADKFGSTLVKTGAIAVGVGAVVGAGLLKMAHAAGESEIANTKMANSIANNPQLAGESTAAFEKLATSIEHKTAADDEAVLSGESVLAQFQLSKQKITELTPLVVDLAQKMGIDIPTAAKLVGKAVEGNAGTLARYGIVVDKAAFSTDHYGATVDALSKTVGGYAVAEGKTFEGSLTRTKNELGDVAEGIGAGVIPAIEKMIRPVAALANGFTSLSPKTQSVVGEIATYGTTALIAGGAISVLVGKVKDLTAAMAGLTGIKTAAELAPIAGTLGLITVAAVAEHAANEKLNESLGSSNPLVAANAAALAKHAAAAKADAEQVASVGAHADDTTTSTDALNSSTSGAMWRYKTLTGILADVAAGQKMLNDQYDAARTATDSLASSTVAYSQSEQQALRDIQASNEAKDDAKTADNEVTEAQDQAKSSVIALGQAAVQQYKDYAGGAYNATTATNIQKEALERVAAGLAPGSALRVWLEEYIAALNRIKPYVNTVVAINGKPVGGGGSGYITGKKDTGDGTYQARGGIYHANTATSAIFGEAGGETAIFIPDNEAMRTGPGLAAMASGGTGGGSDVIELHSHLHLDGRQLIESISRYERSNGNGWRQN